MLSTNWPGTSALIKWILPALLLVSIVNWALGIAFTVKTANYDLANGREGQRVSDAIIYFYSCALPMATTLAALVDFLLYSRNLLSPVLSIIWGVIAWAAWILVFTVWGTCEYSSDTGGEICPDFYVYDSYPGSLYQTGLWVGRLTTGSVAAVLALMQMALGARAVELNRRARKKVARKERDDKRSFELENVA